MSRLPILVLECSKGSHLEGAKQKRKQSGNLEAVQIVPSSSERDKAVWIAVIRSSERRQSRLSSAVVTIDSLVP